MGCGRPDERHDRDNGRAPPAGDDREEDKRVLRERPEDARGCLAEVMYTLTKAPPSPSSCVISILGPPVRVQPGEIFSVSPGHAMGRRPWQLQSGLNRLSEE